MNVPEIIALMAALIICVRLLTFRRRQRRVRRGVSCLAWLLIAVTGSLVIQLLVHGNSPTGWLLAALLVVIAVLVVRAGGNVAHLFRFTTWRH